jgi:hypothetical protein
MRIKDITFVISGVFKPETDLLIHQLTSSFPNNKIILSTYKDPKINLNNYKKNIKVILNKDFGSYLEFTKINNNFLRMVKSAFAGLKICKTEYALKLRTDILLKPDNNLKTKLRKISLKKKSINYFNTTFVIDQIATNGYLNFKNFHISDQIILCKTNQLREIFFLSSKKTLLLKDFTGLPNKYNHKFDIYFSNEQILWLNFIRHKLRFIEDDVSQIFVNNSLYSDLLKIIFKLNKNFFYFPNRLLNIKTIMYELYLSNKWANYVLKIFYAIKYKKF